MLTEEEKGRIRYHLGYPNIQQNTQIALGFPAAGHTQFILETAMNRIRPSGEPLLRRALNECECIDAQLAQARRQRIQTAAVSDIILRGPEELSALEDQYDLWTDKLCDILGCTKNPFSHTHQRIRGEIYVVEPS